MFEIPDEDDNFWNDLPLDDITNNKPCPVTAQTVIKSTNVRQREHSGSQSNGPVKRLRTGPETLKLPVGKNPRKDEQTRSSSSHSADDFPENMESTESSRPNKHSLPIMVSQQSNVSLSTPVKSVLNQGTSITLKQGIVAASTCLSTSSTVVQLDIPDSCQSMSRSRRKFPGPAGLLPRLDPTQSIDLLSTSSGSTNTTPQREKNLKDDVILSSQSSEDLFIDIPWKTLLQDLQEDGVKLMRKFSIAGIVTKAGKKKLTHGKVAMVFAVIETLDVRGSDASVSLRDKSGRMQGTVHRDVLRDYENEFQPGTALVLRQVSVISLTNRNHYLNITPANIVMLYQNRNSQLHRVQCVSSQESLHSVIISLERKAQEEEESFNRTLNQSLNSSVSGPFTPSRTIGSNSVSGNLFSAVQTSSGPAVRNLMPIRPANSAQVATGNYGNNKNLFDGGVGTGNTVSQSLRSSVSNSRPVYSATMSMNRPAFGTPVPQRIETIQNQSEQNTPVRVELGEKNMVTPKPGGGGQWRFRTPNSNCTRIPNTNTQSPINMRTTQAGHGSLNSISGFNTNFSAQKDVISGNSQLRPITSHSPSHVTPSNQSGLRIPGSSVNTTKQSVPHVSGFDNSINSSAGTGNENYSVETPSANKSRWTFKSKKSPDINANSWKPSLQSEQVPLKTCYSEPEENLWQDDLSDDLLSQLSEDM